MLKPNLVGTTSLVITSLDLATIANLYPKQAHISEYL